MEISNYWPDNGYWLIKGSPQTKRIAIYYMTG